MSVEKFVDGALCGGMILTRALASWVLGIDTSTEAEVVCSESAERLNKNFTEAKGYTSDSSANFMGAICKENISAGRVLSGYSFKMDTPVSLIILFTEDAQFIMRLPSSRQYSVTWVLSLFCVAYQLLGSSWLWGVAHKATFTHPQKQIAKKTIPHCSAKIWL